MAKPELKREQYWLGMELTLDRLHNVPEGSGPVHICYMMMLQMMIAWGDQQGGAKIGDQKLLYRVRNKMEAAVKTNDTGIILEKDEFAFVLTCRDEAKLDMKANEALIRMSDLIDAAQQDYKERN